MGEADIEFQATKDIDMILLMEDRYPDFARVFWEYIKEGGYKCGWKHSEQPHFYRFTDPAPGYPVMIELFSRKPDYHLEADSIGYWNNRRICSRNGGLPPMVKRQRYYHSLKKAA